jgi:hypothetical protein
VLFATSTFKFDIDANNNIFLFANTDGCDEPCLALRRELEGRLVLGQREINRLRRLC